MISWWTITMDSVRALEVSTRGEARASICMQMKEACRKRASDCSTPIHAAVNSAVGMVKYSSSSSVNP
jgi:hypothetical protein